MEGGDPRLMGGLAKCPHCGNERHLNAKWEGDTVVEFKCRGCGGTFLPLGIVLKHPCPNCGNRMVLRDSKYGLFYGCSTYPDCDATHGAHPNGEPLGIPADKATKAARIRAHDAFDKLWKEGHMKRGQAYAWMRQTLNLSKEEAHMGRFDIERCERVIVEAEKELQRRRG